MSIESRDNQAEGSLTKREMADLQPPTASTSIMSRLQKSTSNCPKIQWGLPIAEIRPT